MKISVIIPVYNVERYLSRCLDSVLSSASSAPCETEVICVDDGSADASPRVLAEYADRVKTISKTNGGLGSARNAGLDAAKGDYVMFVDSDDWIPRHALAAFDSVAERSKARLVVSSSFADGVSVRAAHDSSGGDIQWRMRPRSWIAGKRVQYSACNKLYAAELVSSRRFGTTLYEDFPFTTGVFCDVDEFAVVDEPLYVYCRNSGTESIVRSKFDRRKLDSSISVVGEVLSRLGGYDEPCRRFALRQAADGHSSTVGQVWKSGDGELRSVFAEAHRRMVSDCPEILAHLSLKAKFRLWRMGL